MALCQNDQPVLLGPSIVAGQGGLMRSEAGPLACLAGVCWLKG